MSAQHLTPGQRIRQIRQARGLSQTECAVKARISPSHWSAIERGDSSPTVEVGQAMAAALGATVNELWPHKHEAA